MAEQKRPPRDPPLKNDRAGNMATALGEEDYKIRVLKTHQHQQWDWTGAPKPQDQGESLNTLYQRWKHDPTLQEQAKRWAPYFQNETIEIPPTPDDAVDQKRKALVHQMRDK